MPRTTLFNRNCIIIAFVVDAPIIQGNFLLFVGQAQDQLGEMPNISIFWGFQNTLGENMHYIFKIFRSFRLNDVCQNFRPHAFHVSKKTIDIVVSEDEDGLLLGLDQNKKQEKIINTFFTGIIRGLSRDCPEEFVCASLFPQEKGKT